jgi:hypothetical protein
MALTVPQTLHEFDSVGQCFSENKYSYSALAYLLLVFRVPGKGYSLNMQIPWPHPRGLIPGCLEWNTSDDPNAEGSLSPELG